MDKIALVKPYVIRFFFILYIHTQISSNTPLFCWKQIFSHIIFSYDFPYLYSPHFLPIHSYHLRLLVNRNLYYKIQNSNKITVWISNKIILWLGWPLHEGLYQKVTVLERMRTTDLSHTYINYVPLTLVATVLKGKRKNAYQMCSPF